MSHLFAFLLGSCFGVAALITAIAGFVVYANRKADKEGQPAEFEFDSDFPHGGTID